MASPVLQHMPQLVHMAETPELNSPSRSQHQLDQPQLQPQLQPQTQLQPQPQPQPQPQTQPQPQPQPQPEADQPQLQPQIQNSDDAQILMNQLKNLSTTIDNNDDLIFTVKFHGGYAIRQMLQLVKSLTDSVPFFFYKDRIQINNVKHLDDKGCKRIGCAVDFDINYILDYRVNPKNFNDPENERHIVNINMTSVIDYISINKKASFTIDQFVKFENNVRVGVDIANNTMDSDNSTFTNTKFAMRKVVGNIDPSTSPNIKIPFNEFVQICTTINKIKGNQVEPTIFAYDNGLMVSINTKGNTVKKVWGDVGKLSALRCAFSLSLISNKAFSCLTAISDMPVVPFYFSDAFIVMTIPLSSCGKINIIMSSPDAQKYKITAPVVEDPHIGHMIDGEELGPVNDDPEIDDDLDC